MPRATVDASSTTKENLKSLDGGYVILRKQTYGERQRRADIVTRVTMQAADRRGVPDVMHMDIKNLDVTLFDFRTAIVEHNLEDHDGRTLDFKNTQDLENLDPVVGDEIEQLIRKHNRFDEEGRQLDLDDFRNKD
jgi:hypothetical protein